MKLSTKSETMSAQEILSSRNTTKIAGFEERQRRRDDEEEDLKWKERRGRTLSVAFDSLDSESGRRGPGQLEADLDLGGQLELPGLLTTHPCEVSSHRDTLTGLTQAFEAPGDKVKLPTCPENDLAGYTETQVKPFTVTDTVDEEAEAANNCAKGKGREKGKEKQKPKTLSKSAVKWVYLQIWLYFYGFRCHFC